jgi:hypothetical protein
MSYINSLLIIVMTVMYGILQPSHYTDTGQGSFDMAKAFSDFTKIYLTEKVTRWLTGPISVGVVLLVFLLRIRNEHEKDRREAIKDRAEENKKLWTLHKTVLNELVSISGLFGDTQKRSR